ncbi:ketoacyl-ACP synthase III [Paenibacillus thiaminolyticus]|uniref:Ketoacyl-ACP synthase III n=1 Tax=Paenibacillus thiaminolyticus TaxID=49283 RepID=A0AAP9DV55_PANTH|nr:ketoacyl-ACP synthase III [Paenibacillus thiaminolyticus]MCY9534064.1 ketoacyl-ACP synthase III [Paenibacillus thiaminolyticus]MCY9600094.1 ketoacyl-ACP synthase III [Paenibacillus thiaminolyticus]MCY9608460.1 ketoacyl-ACP synthase III [Paenibacillus thiaminolyticus]MCY9615249.1 ketoacyl-ACP synthase III [Paenibacillus thiaminolyticus]MCY9620544.1 ketoacyl-ACP synthase III [Paenibacillus thiaminolyticus]
MPSALFNHILVSGIACAVPSKQMDNNNYAEVLGEEDVKKFIKNTGVVHRHVTHEKQTTSDLCYEAAKNLLAHKGYSAESIDAIIFISQTPDYIQPATSHVLHKRLGLSKNCLSFDVNLGCSGYVYGMFLSSSLIQSGAVNRILLLTGDILRKNKETNIKDEMLFGDAGSATLLERGNTTVRSLLHSNGEGYTALITPGGNTRRPLKDNESYWEITKPEMDGAAVFEFTITEVPQAFDEYFKTFDGSMDDYDYCVLHQANLFMLNHIRKKLKVDQSKLPISIDRYGNTNGASIPITIVNLCSREAVADKLKLITSGFGIGLSWGVVSFEVETKDVLPMVYSDSYFEEAYYGEQ